jgi:hypothetical protein
LRQRTPKSETHSGDVTDQMHEGPSKTPRSARALLDATLIGDDSLGDRAVAPEIDTHRLGGIVQLELPLPHHIIQSDWTARGIGGK